MQNEEKVSQVLNFANVVAIGNHRKMKQQNLMENLLSEVPANERGEWENNGTLRVMLLFDHMDQDQIQEFYVKMSEIIATKSNRLILRKCMVEILCWNSSLNPQIEEMAADILVNGASRN